MQTINAAFRLGPLTISQLPLPYQEVNMMSLIEWLIYIPLNSSLDMFFSLLGDFMNFTLKKFFSFLAFQFMIRTRRLKKTEKLKIEKLKNEIANSLFQLFSRTFFFAASRNRFLCPPLFFCFTPFVDELF